MYCEGCWSDVCVRCLAVNVCDIMRCKVRCSNCEKYSFLHSLGHWCVQNALFSVASVIASIIWKAILSTITNSADELLVTNVPLLLSVAHGCGFACCTTCQPQRRTCCSEGDERPFKKARAMY